jgi:hypothetical protein
MLVSYRLQMHRCKNLTRYMGVAMKGVAMKGEVKLLS